MSSPDDTTPAYPAAAPAAPVTPPAPAYAQAPPASPTYAPAGYAPTPPRPRGSAAGLFALIGGGVLTLLYLVVKVTAALLNADPSASDPSGAVNALATVFGVLGILAIVPAAFVVILGHLGIRQRPDGSNTGRIAAAIGLGAGYVHVVAWATRLIVATILGTQYGDFSTFLTNLFWWA